jgi:hypothetical protein
MWMSSVDLVQKILDPKQKTMSKAVPTANDSKAPFIMAFHKWLS